MTDRSHSSENSRQNVSASKRTEERLVDLVGLRDNFNCQVCGVVTKPRGKVGYVMCPLERGQEDEDKTENHFTVCLDCFEWEDQRTVTTKIRQAGRFKNAERGFTLLYAHALLREGTEKTRLFIHAGRFLFVRRLFAVAVGSTLVLGSGLFCIALVGTLFLGVQTGLQWTTTVFTALFRVGRRLATNPPVLLTALGLGYLVHVIERERAYVRHVERQRRRGDPTDAVTHARPRWQFVAGFATVGCIGALDWSLIHTGRFSQGSTVGALVLWGIGAIGVASFLRETIHEDRDLAGFDVWATPWVFGSRYALAVGLVGGLVSLFDVRPRLPEPFLSLLLWLPPLTGGFYVLRRTLERRTGWHPRMMANWLHTHLMTALHDRIDTESKSDDKNQ